MNGTLLTLVLYKTLKQRESLGLWQAACNVTELKDLVPCKIITHYHLKPYPFRCRVWIDLLVTGG